MCDQEKVDLNEKENEKLSVLVNEYCENTTIHGIKYVNDVKKKKFERFLWTLIIFVSICGCGYLVYNMWIKGDPSPIEVNNIWEIPFPSVTICPYTKSRKDVFNYTQIFRKIFVHKKELDMEEYRLSSVY